MIFAGLELMGERPFDDVVIHLTVLPSTGGACRNRSGTGSTRSRC